MYRWPIALLLGFTRILAADVSIVPNFQCSDAEGVGYQIRLSETENRLKILDKGTVRDLWLSAANALRGSEVPPGVLRYNGWNPTGTDPLGLLDLSTEFATAFERKDGETRLRVTLFLDNRERPGLTCQASGYATAISTDGADSPVARAVDLVSRSVRLRNSHGTLGQIGIMEIETALKRFSVAPEYANPKRRSEFTNQIAPAIRKLDLASVNWISSRLQNGALDFWKSLLKDVKYSEFPEVERYSAWVKEGVLPEGGRAVASVAAGFNAFANSHDFSDPDMQAFFLREVTPVLKALTDSQAAQVQFNLDPPALNYFTPQWKKANGRHSLADYPEIQTRANELAKIVQQKDFDPQRFQIKLESFVKSKLGRVAEARDIYEETVSPIVKKLTPRQREDVSGWLSDQAQRDLFNVLIR